MKTRKKTKRNLKKNKKRNLHKNKTKLNLKNYQKMPKIITIYKRKTKIII